MRKLQWQFAIFAIGFRAHFTTLIQGNVLSTTCTKDTWSSSKLEGWDPIQIHCISRCDEFIKKIENGRVECDHNNLINYSQKSSCTILCDEGYHITRNGESVITNGNFTEKTISTCDGNDDGNFIVDWNFSPINVTCEIVSLKYVILKWLIMIGCRLAPEQLF